MVVRSTEVHTDECSLTSGRPSSRPAAARLYSASGEEAQGRPPLPPSTVGMTKALEDRNMAGEMATWGPQSSTADECSLTCRRARLGWPC